MVFYCVESFDNDDWDFYQFINETKLGKSISSLYIGIYLILFLVTSSISFAYNSYPHWILVGDNAGSGGIKVIDSFTLTIKTTLPSPSGHGTVTRIAVSKDQSRIYGTTNLGVMIADSRYVIFVSSRHCPF